MGKVLTVHQRTFELLEADEFTYQYMENNRHVYLMADWEAGLKAIQAQLQGKRLTMLQAYHVHASEAVACGGQEPCWLLDAVKAQNIWTQV